MAYDSLMDAYLEAAKITQITGETFYVVWAPDFEGDYHIATGRDLVTDYWLARDPYTLEKVIP